MYLSYEVKWKSLSRVRLLSMEFSRPDPMNIQDWFPLGLTGLISFLSKGLSRVLNLYTKVGIKSFNNLNTPQNIWND